MTEGSEPAPWCALEVPAWCAVATVFGGVALAWLRVLPALVAFRVFSLGALVALVLGLVSIGLWARGRRLGPGGVAAAGIGVVLVVLAVRAAGVPVINDLTTDPADPPLFRQAASLPANAGRDLGYPPGFAELQRACCPDLAPLRLPRPPLEVVALVTEAARAMPGWTVTASDPAAGVVEAVAETPLFGFQDDVVVRVRADGPGSRVDVRSKSRAGRSDLGANAVRIRALVEALRRRSEAAGGGS